MCVNALFCLIVLHKKKKILLIQKIWSTIIQILILYFILCVNISFKIYLEKKNTHIDFPVKFSRCEENKKNSQNIWSYPFWFLFCQMFSFFFYCDVL